MSRTAQAIVLTTAMAVASVMQFALGSLAPIMKDDLGLTLSEVGFLSAAYALVSGALSSPVGKRIDRVSNRTALGTIFLFGAIGMLVAGLAPSYEMLFLALLPGGISAAAGNPSTNKVISTLPGPHGLLTGFKQSGVQFGALAAGAILPPLAEAFGWRAAYAWVAAFSTVCLAMLLWVPRADRSLPRPPSHKPAGELLEALRRLMVYGFCMGVGTVVMGVFLPLYGAEEAGLPNATAGALVAASAVTGIVARIGLAWWAERRAGTAGSVGALLPALGVASVVATALIASAPALGVWTLWVGALLWGLTGAAWTGVAMLTLLRRAPVGVTGLAAGRVHTGFFMGMAAGGPLFAVAVDATGGYLTGWILTAAGFALAAYMAGFFRTTADPISAPSAS